MRRRGNWEVQVEVHDNLNYYRTAYVTYVTGTGAVRVGTQRGNGREVEQQLLQ